MRESVSACVFELRPKLSKVEAVLCCVAAKRSICDARSWSPTKAYPIVPTSSRVATNETPRRTANAALLASPRLPERLVMRARRRLSVSGLILCNRQNDR